MNSHNKIKAFDLFSGIGGFRQGFESAAKTLNIDTHFVGFSDIDNYANTVYRGCYKTDGEFNVGDITTLTGTLSPKRKNDSATIRKIDNSLEDFDILFAGFPCQAFSSMGKRKGLLDERGTLFYAIELLLRAKKPNHFILENVRGLRTIDGGKTIEMMRKILTSLGYNVAIWLLNASDYGLPQTRRRIIIAGSKINQKLSDENPPKVLTKREFNSVWHLLEKNVSDKYYLSEKIKKTILSNGTGGYNYKSEYNLLTARPLTFTMHKMHRASQDNYYSDSFINGEFDSSNNRIIESNTGKNRIRRITPKEAFMIQGFNKRFINKALKLGLSNTRLYMLAGNAVPPKLVESVVTHLLS